MTTGAALGGGILAAGAGSRLRAGGFAMPKALVPVAGVPLIEHVIGNFVAAGITSIAIILNDEARACAAWVRTRFPDLDLRLVVKTTGSSLESFQEVARRADPAPALISTVDAWCPTREFLRFVAAARRYPEDATVLALTPFVADERPLWASVDPTGRVTRLGGESGALVTAGLYLVPQRVRQLAVPSGLDRLRDLLAWLLARGEPVYGVSIPVVVDVDRAEDVALAEALARETPAAGVVPDRRPA